MITLKEVAECLNVNERTVYRWVTNGELPAYKLGKVWRVKPSELNDWVIKNKNSGGAGR
ncbi:helix-turn-helix domain-containing protein [Cellvibrio sp. UBA7671]|uniref:helix-turn-helix domain-containing protein n=1 Tax=Cellvibrio sp. UBA7671 TaxID=1946312 RepID=UPI0039C8648A